MGLKARKSRARFALGRGLELRALRMGDARALFNCVEKNRAHLRQWMPWLDTTQSPADVGAFIRNSLEGYKSGSSYRLGIWVDGRISGVVALEEISVMHRKAKIGYWLSSEHQGRGYMRAAVRALMEHAFVKLGLETLSLQAATTNRRSRAVAESLGMKHEGRLRQREWLYDHYVDHASYSMLATEWRAS